MADLASKIRSLESQSGEVASGVFERSLSVGHCSLVLFAVISMQSPSAESMIWIITILSPLQAFIDTAQLKSDLADARSEAETCIAVLSVDATQEGAAPASAEVEELRRQLEVASEAANACLLQMGTAEPNDEAREQLWIPHCQQPPSCIPVSVRVCI